MKACHTPFRWDLSVAQNTNCAHDGVVMPVCPNSSQCPGICVSHKSGSTAFKLAMQKELASRGTRLRYYSGCRTLHCSQFPWPAWRAPERVIRIVRHPEARLLSAYLQRKHLIRRLPGVIFHPNASFDYVVRSVTSLPDLLVNPHLRRQGAMCARPPSVPQIVLRLEEYSTWRVWLLKELGWSAHVLPVSPEAQVSSPARMAAYYTPELRGLVAQWAAADIRAFGYTA